MGNRENLIKILKLNGETSEYAFDGPQSKVKSFLFFLIVLFSLYIIFGYISVQQDKPKIDEYFNHIPILESLYNQSVLSYILGDDYQAANTPLPYVFPLLLGKILHTTPNLFIARVSNFIISFFTIVIFTFVFFSLLGQKNYLSILILLFYPYFLKPSFTFYVSIYGLLFMLAAIYFFQKRDFYSTVTAGLLSSFAILSQQFFLVLPFAYFIYKLLAKDSSTSLKIIVRDFIFYSIPLIIPILLFIHWGGLTHSNFRFHGISFQLSNLSSLVTIIGATFLPFALWNIEKCSRTILLFSFLAAILLIITASPIFAEKGGAGKITGITFHLINLSQSVFFLFPFILKVFFATLGIITIIFLFSNINSDITKLLFITASLLFFGFTFNELLAERHLLPLIALLYLLILSKVREKWLLVGWILAQAFIGSYYYYYYLFLTPSF